ncbi:MAG TPA: ABC transporter permease [Thermotogota bacterium]|nr:ABC transporter permease [Thermotogota bacterium]HRW92164.1 ABC transporter permease [Thermotogota bacterium]
MNVQLFKSLLFDDLREKEVLFWIFAFPLVLMTILTIIFSNMGSSSVHFKMALLDASGDGMGSKILHQVLDSISTDTLDQPALFSIIEVEDHEQGMNLLRDQKVDILLSIPTDFNMQWSRAVLFLRNERVKPQPPVVEVSRVPVRDGSSLASQVLEQVFAAVNIEAAKQMNLHVMDVHIDSESVGSTGEFSYADFYLPGVLIMGFFSTGLFGLGTSMAFLRKKNVLKRFAATPLRAIDFLFAQMVGKLVLMVIVFVMLILFSHFVFGTSWSILKPGAVYYSFLGALTALAFGLFIGGTAKSGNTANTFANVIFFPMQFLGGLYFPVFDLPLAVRWFVYINPMTYLAAGIRQSTGLMESPLPGYLHTLVPVAWIVLLWAIAIWRFKWEGDTV